MTTVARPVPGSVEDRVAIDAPAPVVEGRRLHGVVPYNVASADLGGFTEIIEPGALDDADLSNLVALREHDRPRLLGRHPTTLTVEDRADGFHWSVELPESPTGEDVRVAVERGDLRAGSWQMIVGRERWDGDVRHVETIRELHDVSVVSHPAYPSAATEYRATPDPDPAPPAEPTITTEENIVKTEDRSATTEAPTAPGLSVEDRSATTEPASVEHRVIDVLRGVPRGETARSPPPSASAPASSPRSCSTGCARRA